MLTKTHRHRQQCGGYQREVGVGREERVKGVKCMVMEGLTLGGGHTMQYIDDMSQNCTLEPPTILLISHPNKFNFQNK